MAALAMLSQLVFLSLLLAARSGAAAPLWGPYPGLSCPAGYDVVPDRRGGGFFCSDDPCVGNPCGSGNTCTTQAAYTGGPIVVANCTQCNAPYVALTYQFVTYYQTFCYIPGNDPCNPSPCKNGGTCKYVTRNSGDPIVGQQNTPVSATCDCGPSFTGTFCDIAVSPPGTTPTVQSTVGNVTGPIAQADFYELCSPQTGCVYKDGAHYLCCESYCGPYGPDGNTPLCHGQTTIPQNNNYPPQASTQPPSQPAPPSGDQGVCGSGAAGSFPTRCWFNNDPQGRYVCCDNQGCDGFNADNLTPHCKNNGYVPPGYGVAGNPTPPASPSPPSGDQGVCGTGAAGSFPVRCWFNNDPQHRYVCCDQQGCDGFLPPDYSFPHCKNNGYVPPGYGV